MLTKERLLAELDRKPLPFTVEGWGQGYCLPLTCAEVDRFEYLIQTGGAFTAYLLCRALCDQHGRRLFGDEDEPRLAQAAPELRRIGTAILQARAQDKELVEKLEKNSTATPSASGG